MKSEFVESNDKIKFDSGGQWSHHSQWLSTVNTEKRKKKKKKKDCRYKRNVMGIYMMSCNMCKICCFIKPRNEIFVLTFHTHGAMYWIQVYVTSVCQLHATGGSFHLILQFHPRVKIYLHRLAKILSNVREYQRSNQIRIQQKWQHSVHKPKKNRTKTQHNMFWTPLCANKHK